jgi:hypothetical protein
MGLVVVMVEPVVVVGVVDVMVEPVPVLGSVEVSGAVAVPPVCGNVPGVAAVPGAGVPVVVAPHAAITIVATTSRDKIDINFLTEPGIFPPVDDLAQGAHALAPRQKQAKL